LPSTFWRVSVFLQRHHPILFHRPLCQCSSYVRLVLGFATIDVVSAKLSRRDARLYVGSGYSGLENLLGGEW
jgi:hypothetical protein